MHYLSLAVWPHPLIFDYGTQWVQNSWTIVAPALVVALLAAGTGYALLRRPALGFAGVFFFAILAPTSLVPGNRQTLAEQRMYLALAPLIITVRTWGGLWLGRKSLVLFLAIAWDSGLDMRGVIKTIAAIPSCGRIRSPNCRAIPTPITILDWIGKRAGMLPERSRSSSKLCASSHGAESGNNWGTSAHPRGGRRRLRFILR